MSSFLVYDKDGKLLRTGRCPEYDVCLQANEQAGETVVIGDSPLRGPTLEEINATPRKKVKTHSEFLTELSMRKQKIKE